jgi:hypothetical protein
MNADSKEETEYMNIMTADIEQLEQCVIPPNSLQKSKQTGGGSWMDIFKCLNLNKKSNVPVEDSKFDLLPQALVIALADKMDADTRRKFIFLNKLTYETFNPDAERRGNREYFKTVLKDLWFDVISNAKGDYTVYIEFKKGDTPVLLHTDTVVTAGDHFSRRLAVKCRGRDLSICNKVLERYSANEFAFGLEANNKEQIGFILDLLLDNGYVMSKPIYEVYDIYYRLTGKSYTLGKIFKKISMYYTMESEFKGQDADKKVFQSAPEAVNTNQVEPEVAPIRTIQQRKRNAKHNSSGILSTSEAQKYLEMKTLNEHILKLREETLQKIDKIEREGATQGGAQKIAYKNRKYVVRQGSRGGKYILVKGEKHYIHK